MLMILTILSAVLFGLLSAMPGNPVDMLVTSNPRVKPEDVIRLKKLRGLDKPWYVQYVRWVWGYDDPYRPVEADPSDMLHAELKNGSATVSVSLDKLLVEPNERYTYDEIIAEVQAARPHLLNELKSHVNIEANKPTLRAEIAMAKLAAMDMPFYDALQEELKIRGRKKITVSGLFGAEVRSGKLTQMFDQAEEAFMWYVATSEQGLKTVSAIPVIVGKPHEPALIVTPTNSKIVDDPKLFKVDLNEMVVREEASKGKLAFRLLDGVGKIDSKGIYRHEFSSPGQSAIVFSVSDENGHESKGAFSVEHGPVPDPSRFNRGFIFAFVGDVEALGFSNTYKRPVWELLSGGDVRCGDGAINPGETCDDENRKDGDGCSATCQNETYSTGKVLEAKVASWFVGSGRVGNTLALMFPAILLSLLIALPIGLISAYRQYSWLDYIVNFFAFVGISLPVFWFAIMMMYIFAENLQWFPAGGVHTPGVYDEGLSAVLSDRFHHAVLPTIVLSIAYTGRWLRYMRSSMLEVLPSDYIRTARAKGLSEVAVVLKHAFRNALIPVVTVLTLSIPALFGGAVLTETVFSWPGIGRLQYDAVMSSDYYVAIVVFLISASLVMMGNLLADVLYALVDPRIRRG